MYLGNLAVVARALVGESEVGDTSFSHDSVVWMLFPDTEEPLENFKQGKDMFQFIFQGCHLVAEWKSDCSKTSVLSLYNGIYQFNSH